MTNTETKPDAAKDAKDPTNIGWQALAPALSLCSLAVILVAARWYTRLTIVRKVGVDDLMIACAVVC